jgi:hypothetical protein
MEFEFPEYETKQPLPDGRSWTAMFDSWDEFRDNCYYKVKLYEGDTVLGQFMVQVVTGWAGDNFDVPTFEPELRRRIAELAATGQPNTEYLGNKTRYL